MRTSSFRRGYAARTKRSLCSGKRKSKCSRVRGCEYVRGTKKSYCRKRHSRKLKLCPI